MEKGYTKRLESIIKQMLRPLKDIPFGLVIESISGSKVVLFNKKNKKDLELLEDLKRVARNAAQEMNKKGIKRRRTNEVGNDIEPFVKNALNKEGCRADRPLTRSGKKKSAGYPDLEFVDKRGRTHYLECKTYNIENILTTQRSFYLSPSDDFKITKDAHHFVFSFEVYVARRSGRDNLYKCKAWKIIDIAELLVDVKYEFNSDNLRLYSKALLLAEGRP